MRSYNKIYLHQFSGALLLLVVVLSSILVSGCGSSVLPPCSYTISETLAPYLAPFEAFDHIYAIRAAKINGDGQLELITPYFTALIDQTRRTLALEPVGDALKLSPLPAYLRAAAPSDFVFGDLSTIQVLFATAIARLGTDLVGSPLVDGLVYNDMENRFEMYFTNLGFYMAADGEIHLLNYGAWAHAGNLSCAVEPDYGAPPRSLSDLDADYIITERMKLLDQDVPGSFLGVALSLAYLDPDSGMYLKLYHGGVVTLNPADPDEIGLVHTYTALNYKRGDLEPPRNEPGTLFYVIADGLGYNIREDIYNWVGLHSGQDLSGKPVMSTFHHASGDINCFEAYCVIAYPDYRIETLDFGVRYMNAFPPPAPTPTPTAVPTSTPTQPPVPVITVTAVVPDRVTVKAWDTASGLIYGNPLYIHAGVFAAAKPVPNAPLYMFLYIPNGPTLSYEFSPTDQLGVTSLLLENFSAKNGDIIQYEVCLDLETATDVCSIWFFTYRKGP